MPDGSLPIKCAYASVTQFKHYMAGSGFSANWTADDAIVLQVLEGTSRDMENWLGRSWCPNLATRYYDMRVKHPGTTYDLLHRNDRAYYERLADNALRPIMKLSLDTWLISATTVTAYTDTTRQSSEVLTEGYDADYFLEPYNMSPKTGLVLNQFSSSILYPGQQTVAINGLWGWSNETTAPTTLNGAITDVATSVTVTSATGLAIGNVIKVDSEYLYITGISTNTLTVRRGVNGSTAASHLTGSTVSLLDFPDDIVQSCLELARGRWRERQAGQAQMIGGYGMQITRPGADESVIRARLFKTYAGSRESGGVYF